jgi:hypothetical protein
MTVTIMLRPYHSLARRGRAAENAVPDRPEEVKSMLAHVIGLLAGLPAGASRPPAGVILAALGFLVLVVAFNAVWEFFKGPPNP